MKIKIGERKYHLILIIFFLGFFLGFNLSTAQSSDDPSFKYLDYFHFVYQTIKLDYVEESKPKEVFYGAIRGMLNALNDPYTRFLDEEDYTQFNEAVTGQFVGVGIEITIKNDEIIVIAPINGSPAKKAGITSGDRIIKINDTVLTEKNINTVINEIKGTPGSSVKLFVKRDGFPEALEFDLKREAIKISAVHYGMIEEQSRTGYLKITSFYSDTHIDVRKALLDLKKQGAKRLILDLRDNPGGNLDTAINIAELFLDAGKTIVSTRGREGSGIINEYKTEKSALYTAPIIMLVNDGSASASEILAGALKDNKRAKLAGEQTFGKALVQKVVDIEKNKTGFTLTILKYYTPSGAMIHKKGIAPDYTLAKDLIPEEDRKNLGRIFNDRLIQDFATKNSSYSKTNIDKLMIYLKEKNLPVSRKVASFYFKNELNREKPEPLYDLEFDPQLTEALKLIK